MKKKKTMLFTLIIVIIFVLIVLLGLAITIPIFFQPEITETIREDTPQIEEKSESSELIASEEVTSEETPGIADEIEGLDIIEGEETVPTENTTIETDETTLTSAETNSDMNIWEQYGLEDPTAGMEDDDYLEHEEILIEGPIELEEPITEVIFRISNPAYLNRETNLGENGFYNFYDCMDDYLAYYFPEPKEWEGEVIEGSYEDKGDIRTFYVKVYPDYPITETEWVVECNYVVSMNYYEFFCDNINPKSGPNFPAN